MLVLKKEKTVFRMTREQFGPADVLLYGITQQEMSMFDCMSIWYIAFFRCVIFAIHISFSEIRTTLYC